jgi:hypothetical protein
MMKYMASRKNILIINLLPYRNSLFSILPLINLGRNSLLAIPSPLKPYSLPVRRKLRQRHPAPTWPNFRNVNSKAPTPFAEELEKM